MRMLEIRLLGQFEIRLDGETVELSSRSAQSLLAFLLINRSTRQRRERLAGLLWPELEETQARKVLRHELWRLRKTIGHQFFLVDRVSIGFNPESNYELDLSILEDQSIWLRAPEDIVRNISGYAGELLPGFYDAWVVLERNRLKAVFEHQMQILLDRLQEEHRWLDTVRCGECWIARGEVPEPAYRSLMVAHYGRGDISQVTETYLRCVQALRDDLGVDPSAETRRLYERILSEDVSILSLIHKPRHNLPQQLTSFIGREEERTRILERLTDPSCRLITLTGSGGIGKTRLALQVAQDMLPDFAHGVFFIPCEHINSDDLLIFNIADSLGFFFSEGDDPLKQLTNYSREKEMLLLVDNMEHILDSASTLVKILEAAPKVKILTTSRERLNLHGETIFHIRGMSFPDQMEVQETEQFNAIELFLDRARSGYPDFTPTKSDLLSIVQICQLVEGVPLALELSSAWVPVLTCDEIAREIEANIDFLRKSPRDFPERQRSLRASFNHSWKLLSDHERDVFRKLAVFRGGFRKDAAESVAEAPLSMLSDLVDKSLLRRGGTDRFEIHPLVRLFDEERLIEKQGEWRMIREAHAKYFADFIWNLATYLRGADQEFALDKVGSEIDNVRESLRWIIDNYAIAELGKMVDVLRVFYDIRGWYQEGEQVFSNIVEGFEEVITSLDELEKDMALVYGKALNGLTWLLHRLYCPDKAQRVAKRSLAVARKFGFKDVEGDALDTLAIIALRQGNYRRARRLLQECLEIWRELGNTWWQAADLLCLSRVAKISGQIQEAKDHCVEALALFKESGNRWGISSAESTRGAIAVELREFEDAKRYYQESLSISDEIGFQGGTARANFGLGQVAFHLGEYDQAQENLQKSLAMYIDLGKRVEIPFVLSMLGKIHLTQGDTQKAGEILKEALEISVEIETPPATLNALVATAELLVKLEKEKDAIHTLGFVSSHPAAEKIDQESAEELIVTLGVKSLSEDLRADLKMTENVELEEFVKEVFDKLN